MNSTKFKLSRYIWPAVISMVLIGTYTNIDGLFIGNVAGDPGLAAINIAWPIVAFITAVGTGIGVGGSVIINSFRGKNRTEDAERAKKTTLLLLFSVGIGFSLVLPFLSTPLLNALNILMKCDADVIAYAKNYSLVITIGSLFQIVGSGIVVLLRNEGKTVRSMVYTLAGLLLHVLLAAILVGPLVLYGVALATVVAQALIMVLGLLSFKIEKCDGKLFVFSSSVLKSSLAPFGLNFVPSAVLFFTNLAAQVTGGTEAVAAYTVMSYAVYTFDYVFQGVCDGVQPILSYAEGANDKAVHNRTVKCAAITLAVASLSFSVITPFLIKLLPLAFSVSDVARDYMATGLIMYAFAYPFKAAIKFLSAYCYSSRKTALSNIITYVDPLIFTPIFLVAFSLGMGVPGVWLSLPISQLCVAALGAVLLVVSLKNKKSAHVSEK